MNKVELVGRLGADLEVKEINPKFSVIEASVATTEKWKDKTSGDDKEKTTWHSVKFQGSTMIDKAKPFGKGSWVSIVGKIDYDEYEDKNGSKQKRAFVNSYSIVEGPKAKEEKAEA